MAGTKPGRAPKGGKRRPVRFPDEHLDRYEREAKELGIAFSDYVANLAARASGLPEPYPAAAPAPTLPFELAAA